MWPARLAPAHRHKAARSDQRTRLHLRRRLQLDARAGQAVGRAAAWERGRHMDVLAGGVPGAAQQADDLGVAQVRMEVHQQQHLRVLAQPLEGAAPGLGLSTLHNVRV